ncbi:MAG: YidH family protein [Microcoleaceae cyanobacterium]
MTNPTNPPKINPQAELAKERNRAAEERTIMAWIRTCLSMIGFGFGIDQVVSAILSFQTAAETVNPIRLSRILGLCFIGLGVLAMVAAVLEHRQELRYIQRSSEYLYRPRRSLGLTVATALIGIGIVAFFGIILKGLFA